MNKKIVDEGIYSYQKMNAQMEITLHLITHQKNVMDTSMNNTK